MNPFQYTRAESAAGALGALSPNGKFIAGGTNLLDLMKEGVMRPEQLVDVSRLPDSGITERTGGGIRIGAMMTNAETAAHPIVESRYPLLSRAILAGASPQLRNMATNGGNLLQRTRCYYFYDVTTACNKREPGSGCSAISGLNRIHAILGSSEQCIAVHPSDMCVALAALGATVQVEGPAGGRTIPMADFHRLPGDQPHIDTNLAEEELITAIDLPGQGFADHFVYLKIRDRRSYAFALVSVAAAMELEGSLIKEARIALGGVAHKPWRMPEAEALLAGQPAGRQAYEKAAAALLEGAHGYGENTFKIELARRAIIRALEQAQNKEG